MDKQKRPGSSISGGDDSEAFPTSDDHQLASCSSSGSDKEDDFVQEGNRFDALTREHVGKEPVTSNENPIRQTRRNSNHSHDHADEEEVD